MYDQYDELADDYNIQYDDEYYQDEVPDISTYLCVNIYSLMNECQVLVLTYK